MLTKEGQIGGFPGRQEEGDAHADGDRAGGGCRGGEEKDRCGLCGGGGVDCHGVGERREA